MTDELRDELHEKIIDSCISFGFAAATNDLVKGAKAVDAILALIQSENSKAVREFAETVKEWPELPDIKLIDFINKLLEHRSLLELPTEPHDIFPGTLEGVDKLSIRKKK
jgi:hypothetical protein